MSNPQTAETKQSQDTATRTRNRNRLLDATASLLSAGEPLKKLSISRIVETAGMSRAAFYLHFRSKEDIIRILADREVSSWIEFAMPTLDRSMVSRSELSQLAARIISVYRAHCGVLSGIIELAEYDEETRSAWLETIHSIAARLEVALCSWRPDLSDNEAASLAKMIAWACERFLHQEVRNTSTDQDELFTAVITELVWKVVQT